MMPEDQADLMEMSDDEVAELERLCSAPIEVDADYRCIFVDRQKVLALIAEVRRLRAAARKPG